jgi:phosphatidylglycerol:prolipoprotein diacylglycerol transferase
MSFDQFGIHLGPLYFRYYGLILVGGAFLAAYLASLEARRRAHNPDIVWDGLLWTLIGGIVGARLWHIFTPPPSMVAQGITTQFYLENPLEAINTLNGGLGIPGAVIGGILGLYLFARWKKLNFLEWTDIAAPALPLGQAIGRWGNFINQEVYGAPTTLPWGLKIDNPIPPYTPDQRFHPLFLYESLANLLICGGLLYLARKRAHWLKPGDLMLVYAIAYPTLRFFLDFIRLDNAQFFGINTNQAFMLAVAVVAALALVLRHRRPRRYELKAQRGASGLLLTAEPALESDPASELPAAETEPEAKARE